MRLMCPTIYVIKNLSRTTYGRAPTQGSNLVVTQTGVLINKNRLRMLQNDIIQSQKYEKKIIASQYNCLYLYHLKSNSIMKNGMFSCHVNLPSKTLLFRFCCLKNIIFKKYQNIMVDKLMIDDTDSVSEIQPL